jgi:hypothetical protein
VEIRRVGRGNGAEYQRRHHSEVARARSSKRPEQVPRAGVVAMDQATIRKDDLDTDQAI